MKPPRAARILDQGGALAKCPGCDEEFDQPVRAQGGGKHTAYCTTLCYQRYWQRRKILKRRGWTQTDYDRQLERQNNACAGCLKPFDRTPHLDHNHDTSHNRGLLCSGCNTALGQVKEDPQTLRRLMAYLDRDITVPVIYLIGALKNPRIPHVGIALRAVGFDVMDEWFTPGEHADTNWQAYERLRGRSYAEALRGRSATNIFMFDRAYLDLADIVVLVMPAGKSGMLELGYAAGRGKHTCMFLDGAEPDRYDVMPGATDDVYKDEQTLIDALVSWRDARHWPSKGASK